MVEAQNLKADFLIENHNTGYGEPTTFCIVRYGDQEKRTEVCRETLTPRWDASFVFEYDKAAKEALFMFFAEDPTTQISDLFGHVVVPLADPANPVPTNAVFMRELTPIVRADSRALHLLRDGDVNEPTWPEISPALLSMKGGVSVGEVRGGAGVRAQSQMLRGQAAAATREKPPLLLRPGDGVSDPSAVQRLI